MSSSRFPIVRAFVKTLNVLKKLMLRKESPLVRTVLLFAIIMFAITCFTVGVPLLFKHILQMLAGEIDSSWLTLLLFGYGSAWGITQVSSQLKSYTVFMFLERLHNQFGRALFEHIHTLSYRFHTGRQTGAIMSVAERAYSGIDSLVWGLFVFMIPTIFEITFALVIVTLYCGIQYGLAMAGIFALYSAISIIGLRSSQDAHKLHTEKY